MPSIVRPEFAAGTVAVLLTAEPSRDGAGLAATEAGTSSLVGLIVLLAGLVFALGGLGVNSLRARRDTHRR